MMPPMQLAETFCKDFTCCGRLLKTLHDLLDHYESQHVFVEEAEDRLHQLQSASDAAAAGQSPPSTTGSVLRSGRPVLHPFGCHPFLPPLLSTASAGHPYATHLPLPVGQCRKRKASFVLISGSPILSAGSAAGAKSLSVPSLHASTASSRPSSAMDGAMVATNGNAKSSPGADDPYSALDNATVLRPTFSDSPSRLGRSESEMADSESDDTSSYYEGTTHQDMLMMSGTMDGSVMATTDAFSAQMDPSQFPAYAYSAYYGSHGVAGDGSDMHPTITVSPASLCASSSDDDEFVDYVAGPEGAYLKYISDLHRHERRLMKERGQDKSRRKHQCYVPGCGKVYKNANGLKYHSMHTHSTSEREMADQMVKAIRDDPVERPFVCRVIGCSKRYKNANGLKYHMVHHHNSAQRAQAAASASGSLN